jgi:hypothetical protein
MYLSNSKPFHGALSRRKEITTELSVNQANVVQSKHSIDKRTMIA